ncbi:uncharacterized protein LOC115737598 [Rhodamnia argentea]|uniref:Uncharacterized protein LOC115737598 n=1 Tax=Rhodamnia argentea TaxID=178133 RepID=A0A8B8NUY1_9MYRT|nr:uncharacterized protein LOC115737598 [Rhodamnia argentea]
MDAGDDGAESSPSLKLDELIPPRLEDAGLEDCALPLESIQLAFLKAAAAADGSDAPEGDDRLDGPRPLAKGDSNVVAGALSEPDDPADDAAGPCWRCCGGKVEANTDEVKDSPVQEMQKLEIGESGTDLKS